MNFNHKNTFPVEHNTSNSSFLFESNDGLGLWGCKQNSSEKCRSRMCSLFKSNLEKNRKYIHSNLSLQTF
ncbi:hypothetical protein WA026_003388 [Henosepilachna vigintioctopunctata]|uniref:Uncharacterized protein n=1 Tax=Henosepilachna vigintioctopunctata TaxID=420089 RepID=A0AAW1TPG3_9CUCU